ncbi:MAG TPA: outer membrane lipoprotein chaperone LolA, partial [Rhodothermales bacterium]|nr:outer membrane lipoprotein chaperone LolA [Rhodothermales bacterium]
TLRTPSRRLVAALALAVLAVLPAAPAAAQNADAVARRLRERFAAVRSFQADFVQTVSGRQIRGTLAVRGDAFRIELPEQTLVSDGRTLWSYTRADRQVIVQDYERDAVGFSIGQVFTDWGSQFRTTGASRATLAGVAHDVLALVPRETGSSVRDVTLYVRTSDAVPTRVRVHDVNGQTLAFDLSNVRLNPRLASNTFTFRPPSGVEVVDLRS